MTSVVPTAALMDLLLSLFDEQELRTFVANRLPGGDRLASRLPGGPCTLEYLADQAVRVLERQGLITRELFGALLAAVPGRQVDIERVAATWGLFPPASPPTALVASSSPSSVPSRAATSPAAAEPGAWDVFMSYARADFRWVTTLAENLHALGLRVFFDEWEIGPGDVVVHRLDQGLRESGNGILVVSPSSMTSPWVMEEYAALLTRAVTKNLRLIPVLYADAGVPPMLATRVWIDLRGKLGDEYLQQVHRLAMVLKGDRPGPPPVRSPLRAP